MHKTRPDDRHSALTRRQALTGIGAAGGVALLTSLTGAWAKTTEPDMLFADPEVPVGGNPNGKLAIVTFFDYNCPYCRRSSGPLDAVVKSDGDIKLIYKDWPILSEASVTGAILALAAHRQKAYQRAHDALMKLSGRADDDAITKAVRESGVDAPRLEKDANAYRAQIGQVLSRNNAQAEAIGLNGTPAYIVGPFLVTSALDEDGFRQVVKDARARKSG